MRWIAMALLVSALGCADAGPELRTVTELGDTTSAIGPYEVLAHVVDDAGVEIVELRYLLQGDEDPIPVRMVELSEDIWRGEIPGQKVGTLIHYHVVARDLDGKEAVFPEDVDPETGASIPGVVSFEVLPL